MKIDVGSALQVVNEFLPEKELEDARKMGLPEDVNASNETENEDPRTLGASIWKKGMTQTGLVDCDTTYCEFKGDESLEGWKTLEECKKACLSKTDGTCNGIDFGVWEEIDWRTNGSGKKVGKCFFVSNISLGIKTSGGLYNAFKKACVCKGSKCSRTPFNERTCGL
jgi:hypothetical protein